MKELVLLNSGGFDSLLTAAILNSQKWNIHSLFIDYGQRAVEQERVAAMNISSRYGVSFHTVYLNLGFSHPLFDSTADISATIHTDGTWDVNLVIVPVRNVIFLSIAASYAEQRSLDRVAVGFCGPYWYDEEWPTPDQNANMIANFEKMLTVASHGSAKRLRVFAPLLGKSKEQNVRRAKRLNVDFSLFYACHVGDALPCGRCEKCLSYVRVFGDQYLQRFRS